MRLGEDNAFVEYSEISAAQGVCPALVFAEEISVNCGVELCDLPCNATLPFGFDQDNFTAFEDFFQDNGCQTECVPGAF